MKNNFVFKLVTTLLIILMFSLSISIFSVSATTEEITENQTVEEVVQEEKILMYDAETGETTEIDMEQIRQNIIMTYSNNNIQLNRLPAYIPNSNLEINNGEYDIAPNASSSDFHLISEINAFPNTAICRVGSNGGNGSGFLIGPNLLLTNAHCVMNEKDNSICLSRL